MREWSEGRTIALTSAGNYCGENRTRLIPRLVEGGVLSIL